MRMPGQPFKSDVIGLYKVGSKFQSSFTNWRKSFNRTSVKIGLEVKVPGSYFLDYGIGVHWHRPYLLLKIRITNLLIGTLKGFTCDAIPEQPYHCRNCRK